MEPQVRVQRRMENNAQEHELPRICQPLVYCLAITTRRELSAEHTSEGIWYKCIREMFDNLCTMYIVNGSPFLQATRVVKNDKSYVLEDPLFLQIRRQSRRRGLLVITSSTKGESGFSKWRAVDRASFLATLPNIQSLSINPANCGHE